MRPFVVTGCGRSGTAWIAAVVTACGWWCAHERRFTARLCDVASLDDGAEASAAAAGHLDALDAETFVVHQVRHPLDVVASVVSRGSLMRPSPGGAWAMTVCPAIAEEEDPLARGLAYWLEWNALVEPAADRRWLVETLDAATLAGVLAESGRPTTRERATTALAVIPGDVNHLGPTETLGWADLDEHAPHLVARARETVERYGYAP